LGNIYVRPPFATDKNQFFFGWGAVGPGEVDRFFGVFPVFSWDLVSFWYSPTFNPFDDVKAGRGKRDFPFIPAPAPEKEN